MRITGRSLVRVEGPFFAQDARRGWRRRSLLLLRLEAGPWVGWGEASPLPGYSDDGIEATEAALSALPLVGRRLEGPLEPWLAALPPSLPAARFGLETALLGLMAQLEGSLGLGPAAEAYRQLAARDRRSGGAPSPAAVAALLSGPPSGWPAAAQAAVAAGHRCLKLKLGRDFAAELAGLERLRGALGADLGLRLDVNQAWAPAQVGPRLAALAPLGLEFVEEPCPLPGWPAASPLPLARDESLRTPDGPAAAVAVLKPSLLGGGLAARARAAALGATARIWSHAYEGRIGFSAIQRWARLDAGDTPADAGPAGGPAPLAQGLAPHPALALQIPDGTRDFP